MNPDIGSDDNDFDAHSVALLYENGPLSAGAADGACNGNAAVRTFDQAWRFGASYKLENGPRLVGLVQEGYQIGGVAGANRPPGVAAGMTLVLRSNGAVTRKEKSVLR